MSVPARASGSSPSSGKPAARSPLVLREKVCAMIQATYPWILRFPKHERHVLGQELRISMWRLLRLVVTASRRYRKQSAVKEIDIELDVLRSQIALAKDLGHLSHGSYYRWCEMTAEIGRMVGGWIKSLDA